MFVRCVSTGLGTYLLVVEKMSRPLEPKRDESRTNRTREKLRRTKGLFDYAQRTFLRAEHLVLRRRTDIIPFQDRNITAVDRHRHRYG